MRRRSVDDDLPPEWRPGGAVFRHVHGDPEPARMAGRIARALGLLGLWALTAVILGLPWQVPALLRWLGSMG